MQISRDILTYAIGLAVQAERKLREDNGNPGITRRHEELESIEYELDSQPDVTSIEIVKQARVVYSFE